MYSTVFSLPLHAAPTNDKPRKFFETNNWNESDTSTSLNEKHSSRSKRTPFFESGDSHSFRQNAKVLNQGSRIKKSKSGVKRGLDIGLQIKMPSTPKYSRESKKLDKLEEVLEMAKLNLEDKLEKVLNVSACPKCDEEELPIIQEKRRVKPAYKCDEWDAKYRLCILERNIGDTVTFYLSTGKVEAEKPKVTWKKEFHMKDSKTRTGFVIDPGNAPENIIIGKLGYELRISPITETDIGNNLFSASLSGHQSVQSTVYFMIRIVPIDLGFVYVGETIELNLRSYLSFPALSFSFRWYLEKNGEHSSLPSNMRTSFSGSSIKISELRQEQEGILACSMYTNLEFLATKKRFLMKDLVRNNDVLKSVPDHSLHFEEKNPDRRKRFPEKLVRNEREISAADIEKALMDITAEEIQTTVSKKPDTTSHSYDDYNVEMDLGYPETTSKSHQNFRRLFNNGLNEETFVRPADVSVENNPLGRQDNYINKQFLNKYQSQNNDELAGEASILNGPPIDKEMNSLNQQSMEQVLKDSNKNAYNNLGSNPELSLPQPSIVPNNKYEDGKSNFNIGTQNGGDKNETSAEDSDIILNIEKIRGRRLITAEEKISKLISYCFSDYECSGVATCIRSSLKQPGYCKCILGFYGVGVFCREDVWVSKNNFGMEDFQNPDEVPYANNLSATEEII